MQISAFRHFLAVLEAGSVRKAAEWQNISPSAITRQIQSLEHQFSAILLERTHAGVMPTAEGKALEAHFRIIAEEFDNAQSQIDAIRGLITGTIRFAVIEGAIHNWLFPAIEKFRSNYPGVTFSGHILGSEAVVEAVAKSRVDFGIAINPEPLPELEVLKKFKTGFVVVAPTGHPLAGKTKLTLSEIAPHDLALLDQDFYTRWLLVRETRKRKLNMRTILEINQIEALIAFVKQTGTITVIPDFAVSPVAQAFGLHVMPVVDLKFSGSATSMIAKRDRRMSVACINFLQQFHGP